MGLHFPCIIFTLGAYNSSYIIRPKVTHGIHPRQIWRMEIVLSFSSIMKNVLHLFIPILVSVEMIVENYTKYVGYYVFSLSCFAACHETDFMQQSQFCHQ